MNKQIDILVQRYPQLKVCKEDIYNAYILMKDAYENKGKLLVAGNGGSAADAKHIVGELMKGFKASRKLNDEDKARLISIDSEFGKILGDNLQGALPAIALDGHMSLTTAYMNDCKPLLCFAQQVNGYGNANDVFLGISTSGNSQNILYANRCKSKRDEGNWIDR